LTNLCVDPGQDRIEDVNHQKSLFICLFDLKPGGKRYETT